MTVKKFTKTELWTARKQGINFKQLLAQNQLTIPDEDVQFLENTFGPACKKWSQLIAWSWLDQSVLFKDPDKLKLAESIKAQLQSKLAQQAQVDSTAGSQSLATFMAKLENKFKPLVDTLAFAEDLSIVFNPEFGSHFYLQVDDTYEGSFTIDTETEYNGKKPKVTLGLAYPSRTSLYLEWMNDVGIQEEPPAYLPTGTF